MEAVREITEWAVDYRQPNHEYLLDGDKVLAYRKWGQGEVIVCSGKLKLDRRGRKFVKLDPNPFSAQTKPSGSVILEIQGSKGNTYYLNKEERSCSCPGFTFRGECKHIKELV